MTNTPANLQPADGDGRERRLEAIRARLILLRLQYLAQMAAAEATLAEFNAWAAEGCELIPTDDGGQLQ